MFPFRVNAGNAIVRPQNFAISHTILRSKMKGKSPVQKQLNLYKQRLVDQLNPKHTLFRFTERIPWDVF